MSTPFHVLFDDLREACSDIKFSEYTSPFSVIPDHMMSVIHDMSLDFPNVEQSINNVCRIDTTKSITHAEKIDKYTAGLGEAFHDWTNVLEIYKFCGHLERCPKWFIDHYMKIYPNSHSDSKIVAEYYALVNNQNKNTDIAKTSDANTDPNYSHHRASDIVFWGNLLEANHMITSDKGKVPNCVPENVHEDILRTMREDTDLYEWVHNCKLNGSVNHQIVDSHIQKINKYMQTLNSLFAHWSNILHVYEKNGCLEKCPLWYIHVIEKEYPDSMKDDIMIRYYRASNSKNKLAEQTQSSVANKEQLTKGEWFEENIGYDDPFAEQLEAAWKETVKPLNRRIVACDENTEETGLSMQMIKRISNSDTPFLPIVQQVDSVAEHNKEANIRMSESVPTIFNISKQLEESLFNPTSNRESWDTAIITPQEHAEQLEEAYNLEEVWNDGVKSTEKKEEEDIGYVDQPNVDVQSFIAATSSHATTIAQVNRRLASIGIGKNIQCGV